MIKAYFVFTFLLFYTTTSLAQQVKIPSSYSNIHYDENGRLYFEKGSERFYADTASSIYSIKNFLGNATGTDEGVILDFGGFKGSITYGLIPYGKAPHPLPVFRFTIALQSGKASINIKTTFRDPYDMVGWQKNGQLSIGYRLQDEKGSILFDGVISVTGKGPFTPAPTIYEGPYVNNITDNNALIWFETHNTGKGFCINRWKKI